MFQIIKYLSAAILSFGLFVKVPEVIFPLSDHTFTLSKGISYRKIRNIDPRPVVLHIIEMDFAEENLQLFVTPSKEDLRAYRTSRFAKQNNAIAAINASMFDPQYDKNFFNYSPKEDEKASVRGLFISNGKIIAEPKDSYPVVCISEAKVYINELNNCPQETLHAVSGIRIPVLRGQVALPSPDRGLDYQRQPRTALALSEDGLTAWFVVVDGRLSFYSTGCTQTELADLLIHFLGAYSAIEFDGGGSSTMASSKLGLLNTPVHNGLPHRERPVATHLGVRSY